jgi:hypothetical protein
VLESERPLLIRRSFDLLLNSGTKTKADILYEIALPANVIEILAGLPSGYFTEGFGSAVAFAPKLRGDSVVEFGRRRPERD